MVLDASAAVELLLGSHRGRRVRELLRGAEIHAPHLIDVELLSALRKMVLRADLSVARALTAIEIWRQLEVTRYRHTALLERIWAWRNNLSAHDAAYVALAEALGIPLVTADRRLAGAPGISVPLELCP